MCFKESIASVTRGTSFYEPLRDGYQLLFKRQYWHQRRARRAFYSRFIPPGSLVFDVGANVGEYTRTFLALGATVVAVDPLPECVQRLKAIRAGGCLNVRQSCVGGAVGTATLHVDGLSELCTLSDEWLARARGAVRFDGCDWARAATVPVTTLDELASVYGLPHFIKIDVEGYEQEVLDGLSIMPPYLSFEFNVEWKQAALVCLGKPCFEVDTEFNFVLGEPHERPALDEWVSADEMAATISSEGFGMSSGYGDVLARKRYWRP